MNTPTERPTPAERAALLSSSEYKAAARRLKAQLRAILDRPDARLPQEEDHDDQPAASRPVVGGYAGD